MNAEKVKNFLKRKSVRIVLILLAALCLLLAVWKVFVQSDSEQGIEPYKATEEEQRLAVLLEKIDSVKNATVMISRQDETSVVVVFEGEDGILTRLRITEIAASALSISQSNVLVYAAS